MWKQLDVGTVLYSHENVKPSKEVIKNREEMQWEFIILSSLASCFSDVLCCLQKYGARLMKGMRWKHFSCIQF